MEEHICPYGGFVQVVPDNHFLSHDLESHLYSAAMMWPCGHRGALCDRCKEAAATARQCAVLLQIATLWTGLENVMLTLADLLKRLLPPVDTKENPK